MESRINFTNFEIVNISMNILIIIVLIFQIIKSHHGDCRGALISQIQSPDGQCITREAKMSIHEIPHDYEMEKLC